MSQAIAWFCDQVMDEFGSTCGESIILDTPSVPVARAIATERGWTLGGTAGPHLCPRHGQRLYRLHPNRPAAMSRPITDPSGNVQPIRHPDQVASPLLDNLTQLRPTSPDE